MKPILSVRIGAATILLGSAIAAGQPCEVRRTDFSIPFRIAGDVAFFYAPPSSAGAEIVAGGRISRGNAGSYSRILPYIARWNGLGFEPLAAGLRGSAVTSMTEFDFGKGPRLVAADSFIKVWNGTAWVGLDADLLDPNDRLFPVATASFDPDGSGPRPPSLYAAGTLRQFTVVARWTGSAWDEVGRIEPASGVSVGDLVTALRVFDDGRSPKLYLAGRFSSIDGTPASSIASFDGESWSTVGDGFGTSQSPEQVRVLSVEDLGSGPRLLAGGAITRSGGTPIASLALFDNGRWIDLGAPSLGPVNAVATLRGPDGVSLYASSTVGPSVQRLSPQGVWTPVATIADRLPRVSALHATADGRLLVGTPQSQNAVQVYDGSELRPLNSALNVTSAEFDRAPAQTFAQIPGTPALSGLFQTGRLIDSESAIVGRWDGRRWDTVGGTALFGLPDQLVVHRNDAGTVSLFAIGSELKLTADSPHNGAVRWDPARGWSDVPQNLSGSLTRAKSVVLDGVRELLVTGSNVRADPLIDGGVLRWNGALFEALEPAFSGDATDFVVFDEGRGESLYLAVNSFGVGGTDRPFVVRRTLAGWEPLDASVQGRASSLAVFNDGFSTSLYAAGVITSNASDPSATGPGVFRWTGRGWTRFEVVPGTTETYRLAAFDDGNGEALWLAGRYFFVRGEARYGLSFYRGGYWWPTSVSPTSSPTLTPANGSSPRMYLAGRFSGGQDGFHTPSVELLPCPRPACPADVDDGSGNGSPDGGVDVDDLTYFLDRYELGAPESDIDDGTGRNVRDAAVTIDDLLYYLQRYSQGC